MAAEGVEDAAADGVAVTRVDVPAEPVGEGEVCEATTAWKADTRACCAVSKLAHACSLSVS